MHIALVNAFPTMASTAEVEYIKRFKRVAESRGHHAYEVVTSDDIHCCAPDFVIATHEFTPKLTPFFTVGALWSPPAFYAGDPQRIRSILSHDAYLVGSSEVGQFLDDLEFSTGTQKPRSDFLFLPTAPATEFVPRQSGKPYELVYVGVHWDGKRHAGLLELLHASGDIAFYGPAANWLGYEGSFRGEVPYDGVSMQATLARHGIALCVHKDEHRAADTPSMRLFEAAAAGCLIITDEIPFARRILGDSVFRLDLTEPPEVNAARVREIIAFANADPAAAEAMARRSHAILKGDFSLESTIDRCCDFVTAAKEQLQKAYHAGAAFAAGSATPLEPIIDIIVRTGGRSLDLVKRALRSVADQSVGRYRVILADYKGRDDVAALARSERTDRLSIDYLRCENTGLRSSSLWAGLRRVTAPYFAMLDDDDALMPDHFGHLLATARDHPEHPLYYSGVVRVEEDPIEFMSQPNFTGPMDIDVPELRELKFMDSFDLIRLINFDNYIQSNAWIARSSCLDDRTLVDPALTVAEDMYLYVMLARFGAFRLSPSPTALWNWRSASAGNSMDAVERSVWEQTLNRLAIRLNQEVMGDGFRFSTSRSLAWLAPPPPTAQSSRPARLPIASFTPLRDLVINERRANLNAHEDGGVWTSATESEIELLLSERLSEASVELALMVSGARGRPQSIDIQINGEPVFHGPVRPWRQLNVRRLVHFKNETARLKLRLRCAYTIAPSEQGEGGDTRQIGIFLSGILVSRPERDVPTASESQAA